MSKVYLLGGFAVLFFLAVAVIARLLVILPGRKRHTKRNSSAKLMVLLGSGGHTGEMLRLLKDLNLRAYSERIWVHYPEDYISKVKALEFDKHFGGQGKCRSREVKRARRVGQSWITTVFTSISSLLNCWSLVWEKPDVVCWTKGNGAN